MTWRGLSLVLDAGTGVFAAFNAAYFFGRMLSGEETPRPRLVALAVLAVGSLGAALEAFALLVLAAEPRPEAVLGSAAWTAVRSVVFVASAMMGAIVMRRVTGR